MGKQVNGIYILVITQIVVVWYYEIYLNLVIIILVSYI
nr:MAG TPA: hypothetical protein [Caudoviricetes sp.]